MKLSNADLRNLHQDLDASRDRLDLLFQKTIEDTYDDTWLAHPTKPEERMREVLKELAKLRALTTVVIQSQKLIVQENRGSFDGLSLIVALATEVARAPNIHVLEFNHREELASCLGRLTDTIRTHDEFRERMRQEYPAIDVDACGRGDYSTLFTQVAGGLNSDQGLGPIPWHWDDALTRNGFERDEDGIHQQAVTAA